MIDTVYVVEFYLEYEFSDAQCFFYDEAKAEAYCSEKNKEIEQRQADQRVKHAELREEWLRAGSPEKPRWNEKDRKDFEEKYGRQPYNESIIQESSGWTVVEVKLFKKELVED